MINFIDRHIVAQTTLPLQWGSWFFQVTLVAANWRSPPGVWDILCWIVAQRQRRVSYQPGAKPQDVFKERSDANGAVQPVSSWPFGYLVPYVPLVERSEV